MNQKDEALRALLQQYQPETADPEAKKAIVEFVSQLPPRRQSNLQFVVSQIGWIRKRMWCLQLVLFLGVVLWFSLAEHNYVQDGTIYLLCACVAPLLVMINVSDFACVYHEGVLEIELATRYSLPKVAAARLLIFGVTDVLLLVGISAAGAWISQTEIRVLLLYCLAPFCLVCAISVQLLRRLRPQQFVLGAWWTVGGVLLLLIFPVGRWRFVGSQWLSNVYTAEGRIYWIVLLAGSVLLLGWQLHRLFDRKSSFAEI